MLMGQVAPRLRAAISVVKPVGTEDAEELVQDGIAMAAHMLHHLEIKGKKVTPGNVAYYCLLHLKSGRRSHSAGRTDIMDAALSSTSRVVFSRWRRKWVTTQKQTRLSFSAIC